MKFSTTKYGDNNISISGKCLEREREKEKDNFRLINCFSLICENALALEKPFFDQEVMVVVGWLVGWLLVWLVGR